jgi:hypothetical protein
MGGKVIYYNKQALSQLVQAIELLSSDNMLLLTVPVWKDDHGDSLHWGSVGGSFSFHFPCSHPLFPPTHYFK